MLGAWRAQGTSRKRGWWRGQPAAKRTGLEAKLTEGHLTAARDGSLILETYMPDHRKTPADVAREALIQAGLRAPNQRQFTLDDDYARTLCQPPRDRKSVV